LLKSDKHLNYNRKGATIVTYKTYDEIPSDVFSAKIIELAADDIQATLGLSGIYEIISEAYNNEALDELCPNED